MRLAKISLVLSLLLVLDAVAAAQDQEASLLAKVSSINSSVELQTFCKEAWHSALPQNTRIAILTACNNKLPVLKIQEQDQREADAVKASAARLPVLLKALDDLPANTESADRLRGLLTDNHYRLPDLSFHDQNTYYNAIQTRIGELGKGQAEDKCAPVVSKIDVPADIKNALIVDGLDGISLTKFLCGPLLVTRDVSVSLNGAENAVFQISNFKLTFARRRYLKDRKIAVAVDSPIVGGVPALVLTDVATDGRDVAIGNPNFFTINFYSQFSPQLNAFLSQEQ